MAKASKKHRPAKRQRKTKVAPAASAADGISVNEAFHLILAQFQPHAARERFDEAIRAGEVRLRVNGNVVNPDFFVTHLRVAARTEPDGRWFADIKPTRALVPGEYVWAVSRAEVGKILHQEVAKSDSPDPPPVLHSDSCEWARAEVIQMEASGLTRHYRKKTALALELAKRMGTAVTQGKIRKALTMPSIRNQLVRWGIWDKGSDSIKIT
jgi:hypothetical protein